MIPTYIYGYMDDMLITTKNMVEINDLKDLLESEFKIHKGNNYICLILCTNKKNGLDGYVE